jgi:uncharacterized protein YkwD
VLNTFAFCAVAVFCGSDPSVAKDVPAVASPVAAKAETAKVEAAKPAEPKFVLQPVEEQIIAATNAQRAQYGLPPYAMDPWLMESARRHAAWMTNNRSMVHSNQGVAENIAMGQPDATSVLGTWMNSSGHRANILNPGHNRIGVAAYQSPEGVIYWCQQFMP